MLKNQINKLLKYIIILIIVILIITPILLIVIYSLQSNDSFNRIFDYHNLTISNYYKVFVQLKIYKKLLNSFIVTIGGTLLTVIICVPAAYSMCKLKGIAYWLIFLVLVIIAVIPEQVLIFSQYELLLKLHLVNRYISVILSYAGKNIPECLLFLNVIIKSISADVLEAANIDGCKEINIIKSFVIPLSLSGIFMVSINMFLNMWNGFLVPMILLQKENMKTIMPILALIGERFRSNIPFQMAANLIAMLPPVILYGIFKNRIIEHTYGKFLK